MEIDVNDKTKMLLVKLIRENMTCNSLYKKDGARWNIDYAEVNNFFRLVYSLIRIYFIFENIPGNLQGCWAIGFPYTSK